MVNGANVMVDGVKINGTGSVERVPRIVATVDRERVAPAVAPEASTVATLAAQGAPIDTSRVAVIRAGIADGSYRADPEAIATRMLEMDFPPA